MTDREKAAARYVVALVLGNSDARRMSNILRDKFTPEERKELKLIAAKALGSD